MMLNNVSPDKQNWTFFRHLKFKKKKTLGAASLPIELPANVSRKAEDGPNHQCPCYHTGDPGEAPSRGFGLT